MKVIRPVPAPSTKKPLFDRVGRWTREPLRVASQRLHASVRDVRMTRRERVAGEQLFDRPPPPLDALDVERPRLNSEAFAAELAGLSLDVLVVAGAPILKPRIFRLPRMGTVNLHYGIAPEYRGEDTLFWAMYERRYEYLGVTLHYIDEGVDSGEILARGFFGRRGGETEEDLWAEAARLGARLIVGFLDRCKEALADSGPGAPSRVEGRKQESAGRQYFARDRKAWHDARLRLRLKLEGGVPASEERVERWFR